MNKTIFIVRGSVRHIGDTVPTSWIVRAFTDRDDAQNLVDQLFSWFNQDLLDNINPEESCPHDPIWKDWWRNPEYEIVETDLE